MLPVLVRIGPITIYSFGLMMGIAFIVANYFFIREVRRRGIPEQIAGTVALIALIAGVVGAKLFSILENWNQFLAHPFAEAFSASGLTFYGGLILSIVCIYLYTRAKKVPFMMVADSAAPSLILAYGIGRIGCQLSGDGDYGIPTHGPFAMTYPHGTVSTLARLNPQLVSAYHHFFPGQPVPADIPVHPTPVYETLAAFAIFALLWGIRKKPMPVAMMFALYLFLAGIERFLVEFIRLNPTYDGLSQAQWISMGMIAVAIGMIVYLRRKPALTFTPPRARRSGRRPERARAGSPS